MFQCLGWGQPCDVQGAAVKGPPWLRGSPQKESNPHPGKAAVGRRTISTVRAHKWRGTGMLMEAQIRQ